MESTLITLPPSGSPPSLSSEMGEICNVLNRLSLRSSSAMRARQRETQREREREGGTQHAIPTTRKIISQRILRSMLEINEIRFRRLPCCHASRVSSLSSFLRFVPFSGRHPPSSSSSSIPNDRSIDGSRNPSPIIPQPKPQQSTLNKLPLSNERRCLRLRVRLRRRRHLGRSWPNRPTPSPA